MILPAVREVASSLWVYTVHHLILYGSVVDGEQRPVIQAQLHAGGVQVELTG